MDDTEKYEQKIADYIDNRMTEAEEIAFMQELDNNATLRQLFEDELLVSALLNNADENTGIDEIFFQPADEHIDMLAAALDKGENKKEVPVRSLFYKYRSIAAILVLLVASAVVLILVNRTKDNVQTVAAEKHAVDTLKDEIALPGKVLINTDSLFNKFYAVYSAREVPVEVSLYDNYYHRGSYKKILSATKDDLVTMGSEDNSDSLFQYVHLYKGLAYISMNKASDALKEFEIIFSSKNVAANVSNAAAWYATLAYLKEGNKEQALLKAQKIAKTNSPYKADAVLLINELHAK